MVTCPDLQGGRPWPHPPLTGQAIGSWILLGGQASRGPLFRRSLPLKNGPGPGDPAHLKGTTTWEAVASTSLPLPGPCWLVPSGPGGQPPVAAGSRGLSYFHLVCQCWGPSACWAFLNTQHTCQDIFPCDLWVPDWSRPDSQGRGLHGGLALGRGGGFGKAHSHISPEGLKATLQVSSPRPAPLAETQGPA